MLKHHLLPCFTLGLLLSGVIIRLVRVNVIQAMKGDYVEAARARGISERNVVRRHAFRNALVAVVTVIGLQVALSLAGAMLTERTFNWPGIGNAARRLHPQARLRRGPGAGHVLRPDRGAGQRDGGHHQRADRPPSEVLTCAALLKTIWNTKGLARYILLVGTIVTLIFVVFAIFAPWIAPFDFNQTRDASGVKFEKLASPGGGHLLGTNDQFYDIFSRDGVGRPHRARGGRCSRSSCRSSSASRWAWSRGSWAAGSTGCWCSSWTRSTRCPYLLLAIIFAFLLSDKIGSGIVAAALSLVAIYIPQYFRVVRNTTVSAREATYVEAARAIGAKPTTIMRKYLFGNVVQSVPVIGTLNAADSVGTLAALGFLGLGIQPNEASEWGYDLSRALDDAQAGRLVAGAVAGPGDHRADHRADPRRRGPQRDPQPGAAASAAARR